jgi:Rod binding domain-containing protein
MFDPISSPNAAVSGTTRLTKDDPAKVLDAARQFEALLIAQMMKSMHDSEGGWLGTGDDESGSSAMEYGQEVFAQSMASNGGLGLAPLIAAGLRKPSAT